MARQFTLIFATLVYILAVGDSSDITTSFAEINRQFCPAAEWQKRAVTLCAIKSYPCKLLFSYYVCSPHEDRVDTWIEIQNSNCPNATMTSKARNTFDCIWRVFHDITKKRGPENVQEKIATSWENCVARVFGASTP